MAPAGECLGPRFAALASGRLPRGGAMTAIAIWCAVCLVFGARPAGAGINVWTSHGPGISHIHALAIDPAAPRRGAAPRF